MTGDDEWARLNRIQERWGRTSQISRADVVFLLDRARGSFPPWQGVDPLPTIVQHLYPKPDTEPQT